MFGGPVEEIGKESMSTARSKGTDMRQVLKASLRICGWQCKTPARNLQGLGNKSLPSSASRHLLVVEEAVECQVRSSSTLACNSPSQLLCAVSSRMAYGVVYVDRQGVHIVYIDHGGLAQEEADSVDCGSA